MEWQEWRREGEESEGKHEDRREKETKGGQKEEKRGRGERIPLGNRGEKGKEERKEKTPQG